MRIRKKIKAIPLGRMAFNHEILKRAIIYLGYLFSDPIYL